MNESKFQPGFRISKFDGIIIFAGIIGALALWTLAWWSGFLIAFVIAHFFLFCNVFRVARLLELAWSGIFIVLMYYTVAVDVLLWPVSIGCSVLATLAVITIEIRKPSYHGILWRRINPGLLEWWVKQ